MKNIIPSSQPLKLGCRSDNRVSHRLGRKQRLVRSSAFNDIYAQDQCFHGRFMVLWFSRGKEASNRVGVVASKRIGNAVHRNRAKRRLREVFRLNQDQLQEHIDIVLIARRFILTAKWKDIENDLLNLANQAGLLRINKVTTQGQSDKGT